MLGNCVVSENIHTSPTEGFFYPIKLQAFSLIVFGLTEAPPQEICATLSTNQK